MPYLDARLYKLIQAGGIQQPARSALNFADLTVTDDAANNRQTVSLAASWLAPNALALNSSGSTVITGSNATNTLNSRLSTNPVSLSGNASLVLGGVIGEFWIDFSGVTLSGHTLTIKNGTASVVVSSIMSTKTFLFISCPTVNSLYVG
jgi:hypothetical protein